MGPAQLSRMRLPAAGWWLLLAMGTSAWAAEDPPHLRALRELLGRTAPERNHYGGGAAAIDWQTGEVRAVCSSLLVLTLQHCYGRTDAEIAGWFSERRPEAAEIHASLGAGRSPFRLIAHIDDLLPGDVVAIDYRSGGKIPTGHIMVVDAAPRRLEAGRWAVPVIDASGHPHGAGDSRPAGGEGLGRGSIALLADPAGAPSAYAWTTADTATRYPVSERPILLARWPPAKP